MSVSPNISDYISRTPTILLLFICSTDVPRRVSVAWPYGCGIFSPTHNPLWILVPTTWRLEVMKPSWEMIAVVQLKDDEWLNFIIVELRKEKIYILYVKVSGSWLGMILPFTGNLAMSGDWIIRTGVEVLVASRGQRTRDAANYPTIHSIIQSPQ